MFLLFKNYSFKEIMYLSIRFNKTNFFQRNTKNTDRIGVNEQKHTNYTQKKKITVNAAPIGVFCP